MADRAEMLRMLWNDKRGEAAVYSMIFTMAAVVAIGMFMFASGLDGSFQSVGEAARRAGQCCPGVHARCGPGAGAAVREGGGTASFSTFRERLHNTGSNVKAGFGGARN